MKAITTDQISKIYPQGKKAVDSVSIAIEQGEIYGFLGPNGAGKTTTVKLLNGMLLPSEGSSSVFGIDPAVSPEKVHQLSGVVTEHAQMYGRMTGMENLLYYGALFGMSKKDSQDYGTKLLERLALVEAKDQKLASYSTGMRQRLSLARAMIHRPRVLFLDEPTSGLDPESAKNVNDMIKSLATQEGATVFLCTHQLRYAQEICHTYGLIDNGRMLACGSLKDLRAQACGSIAVTIKLNEQTVNIDVASEEEIPAIVKKYVDQGDCIYHVSARELSLEEIYFALIEKRKSGEAVDDE